MHTKPHYTIQALEDVHTRPQKVHPHKRVQTKLYKGVHGYDLPVQNLRRACKRNKLVPRVRSTGQRQDSKSPSRIYRFLTWCTTFVFAALLVLEVAKAFRSPAIKPQITSERPTSEPTREYDNERQGATRELDNERQSSSNGHSSQQSVAQERPRSSLASRGRHTGIWQVTAYVGHGRTASGTVPHRGRTIAAPPEIPFGTKVFIDDPYFASWEGGGWFTVEDRGGAVKGNVLDVYFGGPEAYGEAIQWGRRKCRVIIEGFGRDNI